MFKEERPISVVPPVRSSLDRRQVFFQWLMSLIMIGGLAFGGIIGLPWEPRQARATDVAVSVLVAPFSFSVAVVCASKVRHTNLRVEIDDDSIRAKNLYSGRITKRPIRAIEDILAVVHGGSDDLSRASHGGIVRGFAFAIRFTDIPAGIRLNSPEMNNVSELIAAIAVKMAERGERSSLKK